MISLAIALKRRPMHLLQCGGIGALAFQREHSLAGLAAYVPIQSCFFQSSHVMRSIFHGPHSLFSDWHLHLSFLLSDRTWPQISCLLAHINCPIPYCLMPRASFRLNYWLFYKLFRPPLAVIHACIIGRRNGIVGLSR